MARARGLIRSREASSKPGRSIKKLPGSYDVAAAYISGEMMYYTAEKVSAGKKLVWVHNDYRGAGFDRDMDGIYFRQFDRILSISDTCVDILKQVFPEEQEKMSCVPNLTSAAVIDPSLKYLYSPFSWRHPVYGAARLAGTGIARLVSRRKGRQKSIRWKWFYSPLIDP